MNLYLYDEKHENVFAETEVMDSEIPGIEKVIEFLEEKGITDRYKRLILAERYETFYPEGEKEIIFFD